MSTNHTGFQVDLGGEKTIAKFPAREIKDSKIIISHIVDDYSRKKIIAHTRSFLGTVVLWEGEEYDSVGQWTDLDVKNRIIEIVENKA